MKEMQDIITYDVASIPDGIEFENIVEIAKKENFVVYDSKTGAKPEILNQVDSNYEIVDIEKYKEYLILQQLTIMQERDLQDKMRKGLV